MSFTRTPLVGTSCERCGRTVYTVKDMDGTPQVLDTAADVYVQMRDSDKGEQGVMKIEGLVSHRATCVPTHAFFPYPREDRGHSGKAVAA